MSEARLHFELGYHCVRCSCGNDWEFPSISPLNTQEWQCGACGRVWKWTVPNFSYTAPLIQIGFGCEECGKPVFDSCVTCESCVAERRKRKEEQLLRLQFELGISQPDVAIQIPDK